MYTCETHLSRVSIDWAWSTVILRPWMPFIIPISSRTFSTFWYWPQIHVRSSPVRVVSLSDCSKSIKHTGVLYLHCQRRPCIVSRFGCNHHQKSIKCKSKITKPKNDHFVLFCINVWYVVDKLLDMHCAKLKLTSDKLNEAIYIYSFLCRNLKEVVI